MSRKFGVGKCCLSEAKSLILLSLLCLYHKTSPILPTTAALDNNFSGFIIRSLLEVRVGQFVLSVPYNCEDEYKTGDQHCLPMLGLCLSEMSSKRPRISQENQSNELPLIRSRMIGQYAIQMLSLPTSCDAGSEQIRASLKLINSSRIVLERERKYRFLVAKLSQTEIMLTANIYLRNSITDRQNITLLWKWEGKIEAVNPENRWTSLLMKLRSRRSLIDAPNPLPKDENSDLETANISVDFKYLCSKNYYGPNCNHYCDPRHSVMTHYRCHPQTGAIVCQPGWKGTNCNQAICSQGCHHGNCERPGKCKCLDGWTGLRCDQCVPIAGCLNGKCHYNPILSKWEPYTCECDPSWMGMLCNINKNVCTSSENPCQNGGECVETTDLEGQTPLYACHCRKGFTGTHCEQQVHDCRYHGCGQKGECQNDGNCSCVDGYFGSMCQFNYTSCAESPCLGVRSTCHTASAIKPTEHGLAYQCLCEPGRYGLNCEFWTNLCSTGVRCLNGGRCVSWSGGYRCVCPPKFIGPRCEWPRTACRNDSCANGGECLDRGISFTCQCPLGWTGATCHENVNECAEIPRWTGEAVCKNGAGCRDLLGSYQCLCTIGWTGRHCEIANKGNHTDEKIMCSNSSHCPEQPEFTTEPSNVRILTGNQTKVSPDGQSVRQFFILFTIMGVTIPLALITLIAGVISLVSNCRSYRNDRTTRWVHYEQASQNKARPTNYTTKQYLQVSDCQSKRVAERSGTPMHPNQLPTTKLTMRWSETQMEREKTLPNFLEDQSEVKRYDDKQTEQNEEQKLRENTPLLVHLSSSHRDTEPPGCPSNRAQNVPSLQTTAMSQLPYIDQTVINTLTLLSSSRASSPPPPYEESERNRGHVIVSHSTS